MNKRNLATLLWFMVGWTIGAVVAFVAGLPSALAVVLGVALAAIVRWDPTGHLWASAVQRPARHRQHVDAATGTSVAVN